MQKEKWDENDQTCIYLYTYEYDEEGREIRRTESADGSETIVTTTYTENPDDHILETLTHIVKDGSESNRKHVYDEEGQLIESYNENDQGVLYRESSFEYDSHGNQTAYISYEEDGTISSSRRYRYEYDDAGRKTAIIYTADSESETELREETIWDEYGNSLEVRYEKYRDRFGNTLLSGDQYYCYELPEGYTEDLEEETERSTGA